MVVITVCSRLFHSHAHKLDHQHSEGQYAGREQLPRWLSSWRVSRKHELTFHVEGLPHEQLVVAGLVEEGSQPGLVPDA